MNRLLQLAKHTTERAPLAPLPLYVCGDNAPEEEKRWGRLMHWVKKAPEGKVRSKDVLRCLPPQGDILVDKTNMTDLPRFLNLLRSSLKWDIVGVDAEWTIPSRNADGLDLLQLGSPKMVLLIRTCHWPLNQQTGKREAPAALVQFLTSGPLKVGIEQGNDIARLRDGHGINMHPTLDLAPLAREIYPGSGHWGMTRLVKTFINPTKEVAGKGTATGI